MNYGDLLKPVARYAEKQAKDAALFVAFAVLQGYKVGSATAARKLASAAAKWIVQHGTPTPEKVRKALGL